MAKMTFSDLIQSDIPVLVDFSAEWCGPCKMLAPILKEVKGRMGESVKIVKIDVDANPQLAQELQIRGVPTMIIYQKGQVKWRQSGVMTADQLQGVLKNFTLKNSEN
jgi:thioredoxin 1